MRIRIVDCDAMRMLRETGWFFLCGFRERMARMGVFGIAGLMLSVYSDVTGAHKHTVWVRGLFLAGVGLLLVLLVLLLGRRHLPLTIPAGDNRKRRATRTETVLPRWLHFSRDLSLFGYLTAAQLLLTGVGQSLIAPRVNAAPAQPVSLFATLIPELQLLRGEVANVHQDLTRIDQRLSAMKPATPVD